MAVGQAQIGTRSDFALARYRTNGSLDQGFSHDGRTMTRMGTDYSAATGVAIDAQGRIVAAASAPTASTATSR